MRVVVYVGTSQLRWFIQHLLRTPPCGCILDTSDWEEYTEAVLGHTGGIIYLAWLGEISGSTEVAGGHGWGEG